MILTEVRSSLLLTSTTPRDWLDHVAVWSGFFGALLAAGAIGYAAWQGAQSKKDLILERRLEFELRLLADIRHQMSVSGLQHVAGYVGALVKDPSDETDIPTLRSAIGMKGGSEGARRVQASQRAAAAANTDSHAALLASIAAEVDESIQRRLTGRKTA